MEASMYCQYCGKELPTNAPVCPACGKPVGGAPGVHAAPPSDRVVDTVDAMVADTERAARELAAATAKVTRVLLAKADQVAKDPSGSAKKAARRAASELDRARQEIERALDQIK